MTRPRLLLAAPLAGFLLVFFLVRNDRRNSLTARVDCGQRGASPVIAAR